MNENRRKSTKIDADQWKSMKIDEDRCRSCRILNRSVQPAIGSHDRAWRCARHHRINRPPSKNRFLDSRFARSANRVVFMSLFIRGIPVPKNRDLGRILRHAHDTLCRRTSYSRRESRRRSGWLIWKSRLGKTSRTSRWNERFYYRRTRLPAAVSHFCQSISRSAACSVFARATPICIINTGFPRCKLAVSFLTYSLWILLIVCKRVRRCGLTNLSRFQGGAYFVRNKIIIWNDK